MVQQSVRLEQAGPYTFIYEDPSGHRVPLLKGSQLSTRVLGKTFTAPVRTTQGPAERLVVIGRLARASARGVTLRVIYRGSDGVLCGALLQQSPTHAFAALRAIPSGATREATYAGGAVAAITVRAPSK